ncbi:hypothetical protein CDAR_238911 [Caerostris darwini]|uniref:Uncharacterized protein n=1 Tax=Caerostris darwini TaxID=1538125 RepID=A0AAV4PUF3_9ARAC|nr:hypothetical protein CDAR_238911 [Caerostris darwini]
MDKALSTHEFTSFTNPIRKSKEKGKADDVARKEEIYKTPLVPPEEQKNMTIPDESIQSRSDSDHDSKRERIHPIPGQLTAAHPPPLSPFSL